MLTRLSQCLAIGSSTLNFLDVQPSNNSAVGPNFKRAKVLSVIVAGLDACNTVCSLNQVSYTPLKLLQTVLQASIVGLTLVDGVQTGWKEAHGAQIASNTLSTIRVFNEMNGTFSMSPQKLTRFNETWHVLLSFEMSSRLFSLYGKQLQIINSEPIRYREQIYNALINWEDLQAIPIELEADLVLQSLKSHHTGRCIRFIVSPIEHPDIYYERAEIQSLLAKDPQVSPKNWPVNLDFSEQNIVTVSSLQNLIDKQLAKLAKEWKDARTLKRYITSLIASLPTQFIWTKISKKTEDPHLIKDLLLNGQLNQIERMPEEYVVGAIAPMIPVCPITHAPIRFAVIDPTCGRVFERSALEEWVNKNSTSPLSRKSLTLDQIRPCMKSQFWIELCLKFAAKFEAMQQRKGLSEFEGKK